MPSCHSGLIDEQSRQWTARERRLWRQMACACVCPWGCFSRKTSLCSELKKKTFKCIFCLLSIAAVINPSFLPWEMAGGTIISLRSKTGNFTLFFINHHSGQVFWKAWVIVVVIGIDGVTPQPSTYGSATLTSPNEVINSPAKQYLLAIR